MSADESLKDEVLALEEGLMAFVRAFGLHQPDRTPCGQPVSVSEAYALAELSREGGLTSSDLVTRLRLEKSTVSRLVAQLVGRDWLERQPHPKDGRAFALHLTSEGSRVAAQIALARRKKFEGIVNALPEAERPSVLQALSSLMTAVDRSTDTPKKGNSHVTNR
jgi:DNA-binding MarR family transcriptional regulator